MNEAGPLLAIRADADNRNGTGHVMRTLAIAQEWLRRGGRVSYFSTTLPPLLEERLLTSGCRIIQIDAEDDAGSTALAAEKEKADVLLVDHYGLSSDWWSLLPTKRKWRTAALNDFATPIHRSAEFRFSPTATRIDDGDSGPGFVLIREEIRRKQPPPPPPERARHVLLLLGGADPLNAGPALAVQLLNANRSLHVRAIVGPAARNLAEFQAVAEEIDRLDVIHAPDSLLPHIQWSDTAIVSPSTTAFEMLHHGVVTGFVVSADNQEELADGLATQGCAVRIGDVRGGDRRMQPEALEQLLGDPNVRRNIAARGAERIDGFGAKRICDRLGFPEIDFRPATPDDCEVVWKWANDPATRAASFSPNVIPWKDHLIWFEQRIKSADPCWILQAQTGERVGLIRLDREQNDVFTISVNIAPAFRGKGLAPLLISKACQQFYANHGHATIHAWIRQENRASIRCFQRAAFEKSDDRSQPDRFLFIRLL